MAVGLVGRKRGMTRIFQEDGESVPVTVIEVEPNRVSQIKTDETDGYRAVQIATGARKRSRLTQPEAGHLAQAGVESARALHEFRLDAAEDPGSYQLGDALPLTRFEAGQTVDVRGVSKGKGFAGTVKRHNFRTQDASHGNSLAHRVPGSIGQNQSPGRVFKGKKMAGHLGAERCVVQNLTVVRVDSERRLLLIKGAVPGPNGADVVVSPAVKAH